MVLVLLGVGYYMTARISGEEIQYKTMGASRGSIRSVIQATGLLEPLDKSIRINNVPFTVVGMFASKGKIPRAITRMILCWYL